MYSPVKKSTEDFVDFFNEVFIVDFCPTINIFIRVFL